LAQFFRVQEVGQALRPAVFKFNQYLDEFNVIFELRVYDLNVLLILTKKILEVQECLLDALSQVVDCLTLNRADSTVNALSSK
jgi:sporulation-control protein spo0M